MTLLTFLGILLALLLSAALIRRSANRYLRVLLRQRSNRNVIKELMPNYTAVCCADLETGGYEEYILSRSLAARVRWRPRYPFIFDQLHGFFDSDDVHLDSRFALHAFYPSNEVWRAQLRSRKMISIEFRRKWGDGYRWMRMSVIRCGRVGKAVRRVVVAFSDCDAEVRVRNEQLLNARILRALNTTYFGYNATVNLETLHVSLVRGVGCERACDILEKCDTYERAVAAFSVHVVDDKLRRQALELMSVASLRRFVAEGRQGLVGTVEYPVRGDGQTPDAAVEWRETNVFINADADGKPIANIVGRDITERKRRIEAENRLVVAQATSKAQSEFLFNMSHDVRSPMHAIMGFVDMIRQALSDEARPSDARLRVIREHVDKIHRSGALLFSLLNSVLDVSRLETGRLKVSESPADVLRAFDDVRSTTLALAKEKGIDLAFEFREIADRYVYVDVEKANRVFLNILTNAIKYTKAGGHVRARCEQIGRGNYRFTFADNGIGMSPEFQKKLYERFSREENTTMSGVAGIGLGLSIVKAFVGLLGGTVECQSEKGVGTTFVITIPCRVQEGTKKYIDPVSGCVVDADAPAAAATAADAKPLAGKRVLLVDDSQLNRDVSKYYLKSSGCEVDTAGDGAEAVELVRKNGPGHYYAILMDVQMPVMGGYEATRRIRAWEATQDLASRGFKPVPIIAWSANAFEEDREMALAAGMNDHLVKGAKAAQLRETIARWGV